MPGYDIMTGLAGFTVGGLIVGVVIVWAFGTYLGRKHRR